MYSLSPQFNNPHEKELPSFSKYLKFVINEKYLQIAKTFTIVLFPVPLSPMSTLNLPSSSSTDSIGPKFFMINFSFIIYNFSGLDAPHQNAILLYALPQHYRCIPTQLHN